jgi:hypothetical protein
MQIDALGQVEFDLELVGGGGFAHPLHGALDDLDQVEGCAARRDPVAEKRLRASTMSRVRSAPSMVPSISEGRSSSRRSMRNVLAQGSR